MQNFDDSFLQLLLVSVLSCHGVSVVSECAALSPSGSCRTSYPLCFDSIIPETPRVIFVQLSWISWCWLTIKSYDESVILQLCSQPRSKIINQDFILRGLASIRGASSRSHPAHYSIKEWVKNLKAVKALEAVSPAHLHPVASRWQCWVKNRLSSCNRILFFLCSPAAAWRFPWSNDYIPTSGFFFLNLLADIIRKFMSHSEPRSAPARSFRPDPTQLTAQLTSWGVCWHICLALFILA